MAQLLITGGAGFIGSHTGLVLLEAGHELLVFDDFSNSSPIALERVRELAGPAAAPRLRQMQGDIRSPRNLEQAFTKAPSGIDAVIHFAGLKAVGESVEKPLHYWDVNLNGSRCLLEAMDAHSCHTLVFSSSATVYGNPETVPIPATAPISPINPYGHTKAAVERMLSDLHASAQDAWRIACLRYFNPVGAHPSGRIGENPLGIPNNLFPFVSQVANGRREQLQVFGGDWPTPDGTGVRDYIHVMDLADGHRAALDCLLAEATQMVTLNLGSGQGQSVLEVVQSMQAASGRSIPNTITDRRPGDAAQRLGWRTQRSLEDICRDGWAWQQQNPERYT
ncbi:UDP-glucose 4-epimerase GalE [Parasynechococcus marenigrum]|uniref:UDP-glucose 4-epimerase GalE n=1 Tax=Parasynechococcus marenigrum TaxID=2881428 RepID=UPI0005A8978C|nr:UDP-glucose 4-epimerase GalE [Parasynechococcus marenigrum]